MGWADLLAQIRDNNKQVADEHAELAKTVTRGVVLPLKKLRVEIKAHIGAMEKEVHKLAEVVIKERYGSSALLAVGGAGASWGIRTTSDAAEPELSRGEVPPKPPSPHSSIRAGR